MGNEQVRRVPWNVVEQYEFTPADNSPLAMAEKENVNGNKLLTLFHVVNDEGRLVCNCEVKPREYEVWPIGKLEPKYRWCICTGSRSWLRTHVTMLVAEKANG